MAGRVVPLAGNAARATGAAADVETAATGASAGRFKDATAIAAMDTAVKALAAVRGAGTIDGRSSAISRPRAVAAALVAIVAAAALTTAVAACARCSPAIASRDPVVTASDARVEALRSLVAGERRGAVAGGCPMVASSISNVEGALCGLVLARELVEAAADRRYVRSSYER